jgi:hypothetical protein
MQPYQHGELHIFLLLSKKSDSHSYTQKWFADCFPGYKRDKHSEE